MSGTQLSFVSDVRIAKDYKLLRIISQMISGLGDLDDHHAFLVPERIQLAGLPATAGAWRRPLAVSSPAAARPDRRP